MRTAIITAQGARVAFGLLIALALLLHAMAAYYATSQVRRTVSALEATGQPIYLGQLNARPLLAGNDYTAENYYAAAAALSRLAEARELFDATNAVLAGLTVSAEQSDALRAAVAQHREVFRLLDLAAVTPRGTDRWTSWTAESTSSNINWLPRLNAMRISAAVTSGDAAAAAEAMVTGVRLRDFVVDGQTWFAAVGSGSVMLEITSVLHRFAIPDETLLRLSIGLEQLQRDEIITNLLIQNRARHLQRMRRRLAGSLESERRTLDLWFEPIRRPWDLLEARNAVETYNTLIDITRSAPWPARLDRIDEALNGSTLADGARQSEFAVIEQVAEQFAKTRAAMIAIAIERYRLQQEALPPDLAALVPASLEQLPIDPFSGQPLRYVVDGNAYRIYSIGPDRQDNGGAVLETPINQLTRERTIDGVDPGVMMPARGR